MKRCIFFFMISIILCASLMAQAKYAGPVYKKLIGKIFADEKHIPGLKGYQFSEGSLITETGQDQQLIDVLKKGNNAVVLLSVMPDTAKKVYQVVDAIEIKNIQPGWEIKTAGCKQGKTEGETIIALVKPGKKEFTTTLKQAWRCNRDKIRFEAISINGISCLNEGFGQE